LPANRWAVVTSATRYVAITRLRHFSLPMPQALVTADDVSRGKPDPAPYLQGASLLGINPPDCLVVEDAPAGIRSAHAGKMKAIGVATTFPAAQLSEADVVVAALAEIQVTMIEGKLEVRC
jgi:sugar-phosphatase